MRCGIETNPRACYIDGAMIKTTVTIINKLGLHARASAKFVSTASKFQSHIDVTKGSQTINGKSIMGVMMLAASKGTELTLQMEGPDEEHMEQALVELINNRFGEPE
ncbi:sugar transport PTS system phosphocarrier HPr protein [Legionella rubrilucens]|uniref:Sugar transport PTS system phosphocarrier HPr protein n=2 Tax=Legionella TaxID=445 RepID=A0A0W0XUD9_9GAMM|nr:sugar transport PTS system phosphocarrier HPr protein [Legionella rubrilucens]